MMYTAHTDLAFNLILCFGVFALGYLRYYYTKNPMALYVAGAFGLFGTTYLVALLDGSSQFDGVLTVARLVGYLLIFAGLYSAVNGKGHKESSKKKK